MNSKVTLASALVSFAVLAGGLELGLRAMGFVPSVTDDTALWTAHRHRATSDAIVILGKSRAQLGFDISEIKKLFPGRDVVMLAVHGRGAAAVLEDLAKDQAFKGAVIWSLSEVDLTGQARREQEPEVSAFHDDKSVDRRFNARLMAELEARLVFLGQHASLQTLLADTPRPFWTEAPSREQTADFSKADTQRLVDGNNARRARDSALAERFGGVRPGPWLKEALAHEPSVRAIKSRGGEVVYLKFPACEEVQAFWDRWYPREKFWEPLSRATAARTLHFADAPGVFPLQCPDTSHIDGKDKARVTRALMRAMRR